MGGRQREAAGGRRRLPSEINKAAAWASQADLEVGVAFAEGNTFKVPGRGGDGGILIKLESNRLRGGGGGKQHWASCW